MTSVLALDPFSTDHIKTPLSPSTLIKRGLCEVSKSKERSPKPHKLYYELHGSTSPKAQRIIFIMGLNNSAFAWEKQVDYFASLGRSSSSNKTEKENEEDQYQILVFDNRGVGHSDTPFGFYKTSEMARDTVELLEYLGWIDASISPSKLANGATPSEGAGRNLNVVGVSMGGMIALELAQLIPNSISTLILTSTKSGNVLYDPPSLRAFYTFGRLLTGTIWEVETGVRLIVESLFPVEWLEGLWGAEDGKTEGVEGWTRKKVVERDFMNRYNISKRQTAMGRFGQMAAVFRHHVSATQLAQIAATTPTIAIITGDEDALINTKRSEELHRELPGSELRVVKGGGHALLTQITKEYNEWIERVIREGRKKTV